VNEKSDHILVKSMGGARALPADQRIKHAISAMMAALDYFDLSDDEARQAVEKLTEGINVGLAEGRALRFKRAKIGRSNAPD
jgi:hypothetical protein